MISKVISEIKATMLSDAIVDSKESPLLLSIIARGESNRLMSDLSDGEYLTTDKEEQIDLEIKFLALNTLYTCICSNPTLKDSFESHEEGGRVRIEKLALTIFKIAKLNFKNSKCWINLFYMASYAALADQPSLVNYKVESASLDSAQSFSDNALEMLCMLIGSACKNTDLIARDKKFKYIQDEFAHMQSKENLQKTSDFYNVIAFSNIVEIIQTYILYLAVGQGKNIEVLTSTNTVNAHEAFAIVGNRQWELICPLLRFVLKKIYSHSVWSHKA